MNVYDILVEAAYEDAGMAVTRASDGSWNILNRNNEVIGNERTPGAARAKANQLAARLTPPAVPTNPESDLDQRERQLRDAEREEKLSDSRKAAINKRMRFINSGMRRTMIISFILGVYPDGEEDVDDFQELLTSYHNAASRGLLVMPADIGPNVEEFSEEHMQANDEQFARMVSAAYVATVAGAAAKIAYLVASGTLLVKNMIAIAKAWRTTATAIAAAGGAVFGLGVGGIVSGIITFVLTTGALWLIERFLTNNDTQRYVATQFLAFAAKGGAEQFIEGLELAIDSTAFYAADMISDSPSMNDLEADLRNFQSTVTGFDDEGLELNSLERRQLDDLMNSSDLPSTPVDGNNNSSTPQQSNVRPDTSSLPGGGVNLRDLIPN